MLGYNVKRRNTDGTTRIAQDTEEWVYNHSMMMYDV